MKKNENENENKFKWVVEYDIKKGKRIKHYKKITEVNHTISII